ncbi:unnamed protein product [Spirodela intermedia]|uniref:Uncharacterized protein n=1 Tax=Spirodela intermedia TaxID=51605 RepID=A0A7I8KQG5_SPIIN|nr:unnamed protein product [Spirodela intermedia]
MQKEEPYFRTCNSPRMEEIDEVFRLLDSPKGRELCELLSSLLSTDGLPPPPEPFLKGDNDAGGRNGGPAVPVTVTWMPFFGAHCSRCHILRDVIHAGGNPRKKLNSTVHRNATRMNIYTNHTLTTILYSLSLSLSFLVDRSLAFRSFIWMIHTFLLFV